MVIVHFEMKIPGADAVQPLEELCKEAETLGSDAITLLANEGLKIVWRHEDARTENEKT